METSLPPKDRSKALSVLGVCVWAGLALTLAMAFFVAREAQASMGGPLQRIFYFHVPSAWVAYLAFAVTFISSIAYLRTSARRWDLLAQSSAEIGVLFTTFVLITGPIWARPVWGTWWQWDARLTSTLVLWLGYVGYLFLRGLATDRARAGRLAAVVGIVAFLDVPIVHFSVYWWRTLHPSGPAPLPKQDSGLGAPELTTFFVALVVFTLLYAWLVAQRVRLGRLQDELEAEEIAGSRAAKVPVSA